MAEDELKPIPVANSDSAAYDSISQDDQNIHNEQVENMPFWRRPIAERDDVPEPFKRAWKFIHTYVKFVYGTAILLLFITVVLLIFALIFQKFAKHSGASSDTPDIQGPQSCKNDLTFCFQASNSSANNHMCMALFRQCKDNYQSALVLSRTAPAAVQRYNIPENYFPVRKQDNKCSINFKSCLIEAANADQRIRKYYFEGCLDDLKVCLKRQNLTGKVLTCLSITGICVAGTFYIPPEAVFVCSGVAATCAGYTLWSSFF